MPSISDFVAQPVPSVMLPFPNAIDEQMLARLYAEFGEEDRALANVGMSDYARLLATEDADA